MPFLFVEDLVSLAFYAWVLAYLPFVYCVFLFACWDALALVSAILVSELTMTYSAMTFIY